ncbi:hypothetical protein FGADI_12939 [Fusarium gaditjirri]|uniref:Xylanolytic transcriptional activator regulatory domain-containing protein n=1 Tax=Fusarium gaditjirri TaxID=282569 RepID=A0A8H4WN29_9HYPO|nr:hypothetical protein FGADI_12939 [Fusarium gaditjirri]
MGVQALMAMAMFVEGLGSPCLEYMLLTSAARLAQSQGLHRHPPKGCNLSCAQITQRSLVFWSLYCYDKHISLRAGRPSTIDDRNITCEIPRFPPSKGLEGIFISKTIEHARLTLEITAWMARFRSKNIPLEDSIRQLRKLDARLSRWADSLPPQLRPGSDLKLRTAAKSNLHPT